MDLEDYGYWVKVWHIDWDETRPMETQIMAMSHEYMIPAEHFTLAWIQEKHRQGANFNMIAVNHGEKESILPDQEYPQIRKIWGQYQVWK